MKKSLAMFITRQRTILLAYLHIYVLSQSILSILVYLGFLSDGYNAGWSAPVIVKLQDPVENPLPVIISDTAMSLLASIIFFGVFGSYPAGVLANIIGRKPCLIIGGSIMIIAYVILILSTTLSMMYIGRVLLGVGQSFSTVVSLIYIGEISSPKIRGTLLTLTGVFHNIGVLAVSCVGPFTSYQGLNYVPIGFSCAFILACFFIPDTPVYYILKGKEEEAKSCLNYLKRSKDIDLELKKMILKMQQKESKRFLWSQLLFTKSNRNSLFITVTMYFLQMNSGIVFFMSFSTGIFKDAGSSIEPYVATITLGVIALLSSVLSPMYIDRFGRRLLLIISTSGCCICMIVMGVYFYLDKYNHSAISDLGWLPLLTMIAVFIFYGTGFNNIPHTLNSELYSPQVRGLGSSISLIAAWMSGLICLTVSSYFMVYLGSHVTFWLFSAVNAAALVFVVLVVPETTGKTLTEIDDMMTI